MATNEYRPVAPKIGLSDSRNGLSHSYLISKNGNSSNAATLVNETQIKMKPASSDNFVRRSGELFQQIGAPGADHGHKQVMAAKGIPNLNMTRVKEVGNVQHTQNDMGNTAPTLPLSVDGGGVYSHAVA